jgi:ferritin-like metal-binding protein YciE
MSSVAQKMWSLSIKNNNNWLKERTMNLNSLHDLYIHELKDLYSAEKQLVEALPKMAQAASSTQLRKAFENHLEQTKKHQDTVHKILNQLEINPGSTKCAAMEGLIEEGSDIIKEKADAAVKDAALITSAQRVEHYEMAGYGAARNYAMQLDYMDAAEMLQKILDQEGEANKLLTNLAEEGINQKAQKTR